MADTVKSNMIVPEVWGDMVQAEFTGKLVLGALAIVDDTLEGKPGDTVHFPKFNPLGDADDLSEGVAIVPEALTASDSTATIKEVGKGVEITDTALLAAYGDPLAEIRRQLAVVIARKIDSDLKAAAEATGALTHSADAVISANVIADALGKFGDEADPDEFAAIVIHSKQKTDLFKDSNFLTADKLGQNAVLLRGQIGELFGIPVVVSDRVTKVTGTPDTYKALLVKKGALGLLYKRRPVVETDRDILRRTTVVTTNVHYAVKRLKDSGICVLTTQ